MLLTQGSSTDIGAVANAPLLWVLALAVMGVVALQSIIYMAPSARTRQRRT